MRYNQEQKEQTHARIVAAAGRCFRRCGYNGVGVDGLASEAGVTSGAFYGHFESKNEAFKAAVKVGLDELVAGILSFQNNHGSEWWEEFVKFYMSQKRTCDLSESCALQSLTSEVGRSQEQIKLVYESGLQQVIKLINDRFSEEKDLNALNKSWAGLSMLIGGVLLARAVNNPKIGAEIESAIKDVAVLLQDL